MKFTKNFPDISVSIKTGLK